MTATAAKGVFPFADHRTVAEVWGLTPVQKLDRWMLPVPVIAPPVASGKIDISNAPSSMERRAEGWRA